MPSIVFFLAILCVIESLVGGKPSLRENPKDGDVEKRIIAQLEEQGRVQKLQAETINNLTSGVSDQSKVLDTLKRSPPVVSSQVQKSSKDQLLDDIYGAVVGPYDCHDVFVRGWTASGVYRVFPGKLYPADVYCDMTTPGGPWLIFQRRKDGSENFERTWREYLIGFGSLTGEFWLGNEKLYLLTEERRYKLRIEMEDFEQQKRYAEYSSFKIGSSLTNYKLSVSGYSGNAGDSFASYHNSMKFTTKDADHDTWGGNCAQYSRGAWWHSACHYSNLNGRYLRGSHTTYADGINWYAWRGYHYSLKTVEMKIALIA